MFVLPTYDVASSKDVYIYDPNTPVWQAYRTLMQQWRIAFEIGAQNRERGYEPWSVKALLKIVFGDAGTLSEVEEKRQVELS